MLQTLRFAALMRVNGSTRQDDILSRMMLPIRREIEYISTFMTLQPSDIIVTDTPTGTVALLEITSKLPEMSQVKDRKLQ